MLVVRMRTAHPTNAKVAAELLVEVHTYCCLDGRCNAPEWVQYERESRSMADAENWSAREAVLERLVVEIYQAARLTVQQTVNAAHSTSRSDAVLAEIAEELRPGSMF